MKVLSTTLISLTLLSTFVSADTWTAPDLSEWSKTQPYNTLAPAATPSFVPILPPPVNKHIPANQLTQFLTATVPVLGSNLANVAKSLGFTPAGGFAALPATPPKPAAASVPLTIPGLVSSIPSILQGVFNGLHFRQKRALGATCLDSTANDTVINSLFYHGASAVYLCPTAVINLNYTVFFYAPHQTLTTQQNGSGKRATLRVNNANMTCAIYATSYITSYATISNVIIDGNRPKLGWVSGGYALLELGGDSQSLTINNVQAYEPRGWSVLHLMEGNGLGCRAAKVTNSQFGPSGTSPEGYAQFKKRELGERELGERDAVSNPPGRWADGISLACAGSTITGNTITDATDGGIVIFGAPGSTISGNTITTNTRQLMGGINMVDISPWNGNYTGTSVTNNKLISQGSFMKIGIAIGTLSWQSYNATWARNFGGTVTGNTFSSGTTGYFGYGISVAGHNNTKVTGNLFNSANFGGAPTGSCAMMTPTPQGLVQNPYTTTGSSFQSSFNATVFNFLPCNGPGPIVKSKYTLTKGTRRSDLVTDGKKRMNLSEGERKERSYQHIDDLEVEGDEDQAPIEVVVAPEVAFESTEDAESMNEIAAVRAKHVAKVKSRSRRRGIH